VIKRLFSSVIIATMALKEHRMLIVLFANVLAAASVAQNRSDSSGHTATRCSIVGDLEIRPFASEVFRNTRMLRIRLPPDSGRQAGERWAMSLESKLVAFRMSVPRLRHRSAHHTPKWRDETLVRCAKSVILRQAQNRSKFPRALFL
jgi:hypothetical protein